jgi:hypothetical protein
VILLLHKTRAGSMGVDLVKMTERFCKGLEFSSSKDDYELDYGVVEVPFGRVRIPSSRRPFHCVVIPVIM